MEPRDRHTCGDAVPSGVAGDPAETSGVKRQKEGRRERKRESSHSNSALYIYFCFHNRFRVETRVQRDRDKALGH